MMVKDLNNPLLSIKVQFNDSLNHVHVHLLDHKQVKQSYRCTLEVACYLLKSQLNKLKAVKNSIQAALRTEEPGCVKLMHSTFPVQLLQTHPEVFAV